MDVDEAPDAELLCTTELVAVHDDQVAEWRRSLPMSTLRQILDSDGGVARVERTMPSRSPVSPRVNLKSMFFSARSETSLNHEECDLSRDRTSSIFTRMRVRGTKRSEGQTEAIVVRGSNFVANGNCGVACNDTL